MENKLPLTKELIKMYSCDENALERIKISKSFQFIVIFFIFILPTLSSQILQRYDIHDSFTALYLFINVGSMSLGSGILFYKDNHSFKKTGFAPAANTITTLVFGGILFIVFKPHSLWPQTISQMLVLIYLFAFHHKEYWKTISVNFRTMKSFYTLLIIVLVGTAAVLAVGYAAEELVGALKNLLPKKISIAMSDGSANQKQLESGLGSIASYISLFMLTILVAPMIEEMVYRKGVFDIIENKVIALIFSSLLFGCIHIHLSGPQGWYEYINVLSYASSGLVFASIYYLTENYTGSWLVHLTTNLIAFIMIATR